MNKLLAQSVPLEQITGSGRFVPTNPNTAGEQVDSFFSVMIGFLTIVAGLGFLIYFVLGALKWLTAGGDASKADAAKKNMTDAFIGLVIVVAAYTITWIVSEVLGFDILNPQEALQNISP